MPGARGEYAPGLSMQGGEKAIEVDKKKRGHDVTAPINYSDSDRPGQAVLHSAFTFSKLPKKFGEKCGPTDAPESAVVCAAVRLPRVIGNLV